MTKKVIGTINGIEICEPDLSNINIDQIMKEHNERMVEIKKRFDGCKNISVKTLFTRIG